MARGGSSWHCICSRPAGRHRLLLSGIGGGTDLATLGRLAGIETAPLAPRITEEALEPGGRLLPVAAGLCGDRRDVLGGLGVGMPPHGAGSALRVPGVRVLRRAAQEVGRLGRGLGRQRARHDGRQVLRRALVGGRGRDRRQVLGGALVGGRGRDRRYVLRGALVDTGSSIWRMAGPVLPIGKNSSGSSSRQAERWRQSMTDDSLSV